MTPQSAPAIVAFNAAFDRVLVNLGCVTDEREALATEARECLAQRRADHWAVLAAGAARRAAARTTLSTGVAELAVASTAPTDLLAGSWWAADAGRSSNWVSAAWATISPWTSPAAPLVSGGVRAGGDAVALDEGESPLGMQPLAWGRPGVLLGRPHGGSRLGGRRTADRAAIAAPVGVPQDCNKVVLKP